MYALGYTALYHLLGLANKACCDSRLPNIPISMVHINNLVDFETVRGDLRFNRFACKPYIQCKWGRKVT